MKKPTSKERLKLWCGNAREWISHEDASRLGIPDNGGVSFYCAARSVAELKSMFSEYLGREPMGFEGKILKYFSKGVWGLRMDGVDPEKGIWMAPAYTQAKPIRIWPVQRSNLSGIGEGVEQSPPAIKGG